MQHQQTIRVPTRPGQPGNSAKYFPVLEITWNLKFGKCPGKSWKCPVRKLDFALEGESRCIVGGKCRKLGFYYTYLFACF